MGGHLKALVKAESYSKVADAVGRRSWFLFSRTARLEDGGSDSR